MAVRRSRFGLSMRSPYHGGVNHGEESLSRVLTSMVKDWCISCTRHLRILESGLLWKPARFPRQFRYLSHARDGCAVGDHLSEIRRANFLTDGTGILVDYHNEEAEHGGGRASIAGCLRFPSIG